MKLSQLAAGSLVIDRNTKYNNATIVWRVLEQGHTGDPADSTTLMTKDLITLKPFDGKESTNPNPYIQSYGYNRYSKSNILQWLNSDAAASEWYSAQHTYDAPPSAANVYVESGTALNPYQTEAGFLSNFSVALKAALMSATKTTVLSTNDGGGSENVTSKVFMLSNTEVGFSNENGIAEGSLYSYFTSATVRKMYLANNAAKGNYADAPDPCRWYLRTPSSSTANVVNYVGVNGDAGGSESAYSGYIGIVPAICISNDIDVSDTPDENGYYRLLFPPKIKKGYRGNSSNQAVTIGAFKGYVGDSNDLSKSILKAYVSYDGKAVAVEQPVEPKVYGAV